MAPTRNNLIRGLLGAFVATSLAGCTQTCTPAAVVGQYSMRSGPQVYELALENQGTGSLSRNGMVETFTWEWWSESEQPFLHVSQPVIDDLMARAGTPRPRGTVNTHSGYLGLIPQCRAGELDIGVDGALRFVRTRR